MGEEPHSVLRASAERASRRQIAAEVTRGRLERIAPGIYFRPDELDDTAATWASISLRRSEATLCLLTALVIHDLTDDIPTESHVALPRGAHRLTVDWMPVRWHFFDRVTFEIGRHQHSVTDQVGIGLYSAERTIIDTFRLRHIWGSDLANTALKRWLARRGSSPASLLRMSERFPIARPALQRALEVLL